MVIVKCFSHSSYALLRMLLETQPKDLTGSEIAHLLETSKVVDVDPARAV
jgi:hypothetical protein